MVKATTQRQVYPIVEPTMWTGVQSGARQRRGDRQPERDICGPASKAGLGQFRPQVIGMQQLSQIDWGFHSAPISAVLSILTLLPNTLVQVGGVPPRTPIHTDVGDEHFATPIGEARILVIERKGSV